MRKRVVREWEGLARGLEHRLSYMGREALARKVEVEPLECVFKREPLNMADKNAIKVIVKDATDSKWDGQFIGYLARQQAAVIAPFWDKGRLEFKQVWLMAVDAEEGDATLRVIMKVAIGLKVVPIV